MQCLEIIHPFNGFGTPLTWLRYSMVLLCLGESVSLWWLAHKGRNPVWNESLRSKFKIVSVGSMAVFQLGAGIAFYATVKSTVNECFQRPANPDRAVSVQASHFWVSSYRGEDARAGFLHSYLVAAQWLLVASIGSAIATLGPLLSQRVIASKWRYHPGPDPTRGILPLRTADRQSALETQHYPGPLAVAYERWQKERPHRDKQLPGFNSPGVVIALASNLDVETATMPDVVPSPAAPMPQGQLRFHESLVSWSQLHGAYSNGRLFFGFSVLQATLIVLQLVRLIVLAKLGLAVSELYGG